MIVTDSIIRKHFIPKTFTISGNFISGLLTKINKTKQLRQESDYACTHVCSQ